MLVVTFSFAITKLKYSSIEHYYIGSTLKLPFPDKNNITSGIKYDSAKTTNLYSVKLSNGKNFYLTYPMLSYLPDVVEEPNSHLYGIKEHENMPLFEMVNNFKKYFNMLSQHYTADDGKVYYIPDWLPKVDQIVKQNDEDNRYNIVNKLPITDYLDQKFNCITGGTCSSNILAILSHPGLSLKIASKDGDHFGKAAIKNYLLGHYTALMYASSAKDVEGLKLAYSYEAYAAHYLEDSFVGGHQLTPVQKIFEYEHSEDIDKIYHSILLFPVTTMIDKHMFVSILTRLEHNYLNRTGVLFKRVIDKTPWISYGDDRLFIPQNQTNVSKIRDTLQRGIMQIYHVYKHDEPYADINKDISDMRGYMPDLSYIYNNNKPMFVLSHNKLYDVVDGIYNPDGTSSMLCLLKNHLDEVLLGQTASSTIKTLLTGLLFIECPKSYMDGIAATTAVVKSSNNHIETVGSRVHVNSTTPTFFDYPVLSLNGVTCQFTLPVKFYNYGLLNSLDIADFSGVKNLQYVNTISSNYLTCKGFTAVYRNSTDRSKRMFTLIKGELPSNVKVCNDSTGGKFLANKNFNCKFE